MKRVRLVATDIDGTLTEKRGSLLISLEAVEAIRRLEANGVTVTLVSGNSLPVTAGLARYLGATGPSIAENGCVVFDKGRIIHVCRGRPPEELVEELIKMGFRESWQNAYRHHDLAFYIPREEALGEAVKIVEEYGFVAFSSGYALHVQPPGGGKDTGLRTVARLLDIGVEEVLAVGDGENDLPMLVAAGFSACPGDADDAVKEIVDYVAGHPGGRGFAEIVEWILAGAYTTGSSRQG